MTEGHAGGEKRGLPSRSRRAITVAAVAAAMMAAQAAQAGYAQAQDAAGGPVPPSPSPGGFSSKKECKQFYKDQGQTRKEAKQTCKQFEF